MNTLLAITAVMALISLLLLVSMVRNVRRRRVLRAGGSLVACIATAALGTVGVMIVLSYVSYARLTDEAPVGTIEFRQQSPGVFDARLMRPEQPDTTVTLAGDEWQLDARIISWQAPATILGLEPIFQLERLSGRYSDVERERSESRSVHSLAERQALDLWSVARRYPRWLPGVDAHYGTATYVPMADGARYEITMTRNALIARPGNARAEQAVGDWGEDGN